MIIQQQGLATAGAISQTIKKYRRYYLSLTQSCITKLVFIKK